MREMIKEAKEVFMTDTKLLTKTAALTALIFVATRFIQIPIPLGYFTFANAIIMSSLLFLPKSHGIFASAIGSSLADLTSFPAYTVPTLVIKGLFPLIFYMLYEKGHKKLAPWVSMLIPLIGYTAVGAFMAGSIITGLSQFPGLFVEYIINGIIFFAIERKIGRA